MQYKGKVIDIRAKDYVIYQTRLSIDKLQGHLSELRHYGNDSDDVKRIQAAADECDHMYRDSDHLTYSQWVHLYERIHKLRDYEEDICYWGKTNLPDKI